MSLNDTEMIYYSCWCVYVICFFYVVFIYIAFIVLGVDRFRLYNLYMKFKVGVLYRIVFIKLVHKLYD